MIDKRNKITNEKFDLFYFQKTIQLFSKKQKLDNAIDTKNKKLDLSTNNLDKILVINSSLSENQIIKHAYNWR